MKIVAIAGLIVVMLAAFGFTPTAMAREKVVMDGSTTVYPIAKAFAGYYMAKHPDVKVTVSGTGSGNGAKSLVQGSCDIACMSRFMKDKEFKMAIDDGIHPVFHTVAMDGIAVVVHPSNPVNGLTLEQLHKIYNGKITNWNEVGGPNKDIVVISRDSTSGTFEVFGDLVLKGDRLTGGAERAASNAEVQQRVKTTQSAIGYLGLGYIEGVKAVAVNGVKPNLKTVGSGQYAIARPLFMVTNGYPALGSPEQAIVTMYLKPYGQEMIKDIGYVPVTQY
ncbi:MAG: PstS family phosphate ABC transporter substrate-binding protein [Planctomycetes bacterium]|nr:PstS family phosphate ABC transporter substrate-binding protein [Planctomycetota bacterium]